jgi:hypothetical protein
MSGTIITISNIPSSRILQEIDSANNRSCCPILAFVRSETSAVGQQAAASLNSADGSIEVILPSFATSVSSFTVALPCRNAIRRQPLETLSLDVQGSAMIKTCERSHAFEAICAVDGGGQVVSLDQIPVSINSSVQVSGQPSAVRSSLRQVT